MKSSSFCFIGGTATEHWGLVEMWIEDPDGIRTVLLKVPSDHLSAVTRDRCHRVSETDALEILRYLAFAPAGLLELIEIVADVDIRSLDPAMSSPT